MRIAVISDIHSNIMALDSVLADIDSKNIDTIFFVQAILLGIYLSLKKLSVGLGRRRY